MKRFDTIRVAYLYKKTRGSADHLFDCVWGRIPRRVRLNSDVGSTNSKVGHGPGRPVPCAFVRRGHGTRTFCDGGPNTEGSFVRV